MTCPPFTLERPLSGTGLPSGNYWKMMRQTQALLMKGSGVPVYYWDLSHWCMWQPEGRSQGCIVTTSFTRRSRVRGCGSTQIRGSNLLALSVVSARIGAS